MITLFLPCTDGDDTETDLDRIDYTSFSQQSLMEMLVREVRRRPHSWGTKEAPADISEWNGLDSNDNDEVVCIRFEGYAFGGSMSFQWLPSTLVEMYLNSTKLHGSIDLSTLPEAMKVVQISKNEFYTPIDLTELPEKMVDLALPKNKMIGSLNLTKLPKTLQRLYLLENRFEGEVCLTKLPESLEVLYISANYCLFGTVDAKSLPKSLKRISVGRTRITGTVYRRDLPKSVERFIFQESNVQYEDEIRNKPPIIPKSHRQLWEKAQVR